QPREQAKKDTEPDENAPALALLPRINPSGARGKSGKSTKWRAANETAKILAKSRLPRLASLPLHRSDDENQAKIPKRRPEPHRADDHQHVLQNSHQSS